MKIFNGIIMAAFLSVSSIALAQQTVPCAYTKDVEQLMITSGLEVVAEDGTSKLWANCDSGEFAVTTILPSDVDKTCIVGHGHALQRLRGDGYCATPVGE